MCSLDVPACEPAAAVRTYLPGTLLDVGIGSLLIAPWFIAWWLLADLSGWPLNDDPFYAKPLAFWADDGRIQLVRQYGYLTASSVAHVVTGALASLSGFGFRQLYLVCIAQQALGALAVYWFARRINLSPGIATLAAATLISYPLYFGHAFTFMTDGPATAWSAFACVAVSIGFIEGNRAWLSAGALAIGWGYWIRQTNGALLIAPSALLLLAWLKPELRLNRAVMWPLIIALAMITALECGWILPASSGRLSDIAPQPTDGYWKRTLIAGYGWLLLAGWCALPLAPWLMIQAWHESTRCDRNMLRGCHGGAAAVLMAGLLPFVLTSGRAHITSATGSFIQNGHFGPIFLSDMDEPGRWGSLGGVQWPAAVWQCLSLLSIVSSAVVAWWASWTVIHVWRSGRGAVAHSMVAYACGWLVMLATAAAALTLLVEPHMDRYWLFLMPVLLVFCLLLAADRKWKLDRVTIAWSTLCILAQLGMSIVFVHDMLAWNNARWQFVSAHLAAGNAAETIDAGRDVNAWLRMDEDPDTSARTGDQSRWWSGHSSICIATGPRPDWQLHAQLPWHSWATGQTHFLFVLRRSDSNR